MVYWSPVPVKLIIQIPCRNEEQQLGATLDALPRSLPGISSIEVLIIDDASTDRTAQVAREHGVHHLVRFKEHRGLASAYMAGLDAATRLGADIICHTDADHQYHSDDIDKLIAPILSGQAQLVVGDRQTDQIAHFSPAKRWLQRWGTRVVRRFSNTPVTDATSGFRALSRDAAMRLFVHNRFTYTLETLIQAGNLGIRVQSVPIRTNPQTRESRLFSSNREYVRRSASVLLRSYGMYAPVKSFGLIALVLAALGVSLGGRFLYFYLQDPSYSGHIQSLQVGVGAIVLAFVVALMALLSDLLAANRRLQEETLWRVRRIDAALADHQRAQGQPLENIERTGATPWHPL